MNSNMEKPYVVGIDIGGTNTVFGIVDARGTILASGSIKTGAYDEADNYVDEVCKNLLPLIIANGGVDKIKGIDLDIRKGEFVSIMGASGSGKSTLLNIIGILDNYDTGEYYLNGTLIKNLSENKAAGHFVGHVVSPLFQPQSFQIFQRHSVTLPAAYSLIEERKSHILYRILEGNQIE